MKNPYVENKFFVDHFKSDTAKLSFGDWNNVFRGELIRLLSEDYVVHDDDLENLHLVISIQYFIMIL